MDLTPVNGSQAAYHTYLMRLWRETPQSPWRVPLIAAGSQEQLLFSSLEGLFVFLEEITVPAPPES